jgi:uncharacterized protein YuzE
VRSPRLDQNAPMHGTFDAQADAAYLYLVDEIPRGAAKRQVPLEGEGLKPMVVLDLDEEDRILGIEVVGATGSLHPETLSMLKRIG